ncbi:FabG-like 3-oxoacyl-(acyl-carrier-protein) reductase [Xanthomonas phage XcP1]|uniref:3-oxoacyl-(Acyl-carrier-protein) reductase n=1 Tax=Xanthomonas phage XcP1 TaxID=2785027 RepID=A0A3S7L8I7_9CAUD|nr:FabG-like 3-oxoacyl-(acyl-carrier-protein) reductase [Xanthomonas phage XcP1]AWN08549.1 3-oxoacyl-(acyl-carrier-protein) reductase [Xanthomonas phage XcP1]
MEKKTVLVTGAASGLGKAIAGAFHALGHNVIRLDIQGQIRVDVTSSSSTRLVGESVDKVDVLVNCAGINSNEWFEDLNRATFDRVMGTNAWGIVNMTQSVLRQLIESKGTVINIVSNAAHIPMTSSLAYNASKAAALMITKQMAHELTPRHGITVFSVSPNKLSGTGMSKSIEDNVVKTRGWTAEYAREYQRKALMHGRETDPEALGKFIAGLVQNEDIRFLSGCDIPYGK